MRAHICARNGHKMDDLDNDSWKYLLKTRVLESVKSVKLVAPLGTKITTMCCIRRARQSTFSNIHRKSQNKSVQRSATTMSLICVALDSKVRKSALDWVPTFQKIR